MSKKKNFKVENPAIDAISQLFSTELKEDVKKEELKKEETKQTQDNLIIDGGTVNKKISADAKIPEGYKLVTESRTQRIQGLTQPSIYKALRERADKENISVNEAINRAIVMYLDN